MQMNVKTTYYEYQVTHNTNLTINLLLCKCEVFSRDAKFVLQK